MRVGSVRQEEGEGEAFEKVACSAITIKNATELARAVSKCLEDDMMRNANEEITEENNERDLRKLQMLEMTKNDN